MNWSKDIVNAARTLLDNIQNGEIKQKDIDQDLFSSFLQLGGIPDPDLLIRTGGEKRVSNFLLWNIAYSELFFCDCLWPDFTSNDLDKAIEFFSTRQRRYGVSV